MLGQQEADDLIAMDKQLVDPRRMVQFPIPGSTEDIPLESLDGRERFQLDIECGRLNDKWKLQLRYRSAYILVRLDIGGGGHRNPRNAPTGRLAQYEGKTINTPHLQRYVEGYDDQWAIPVPPEFTNPNDIDITWRQFLNYCHIIVIPPLQGRLMR